MLHLQLAVTSRAEPSHEVLASARWRGGRPEDREAISDARMQRQDRGRHEPAIEIRAGDASIATAIR